MKRALLCAAVVALAFGLIRDNPARAADNHQYQVKIDNFSFSPPTLTVPAGATVTWINHDDVPHTVVSKNGKDFKSPVLDTDQKYTRSFARAGTYDYYCSLHPHMTAKVIVQ